MNRLTRWLAIGVTALCASAAASAEDAPKKKGYFQAQRAGWMLGMYVGEGTGGPYPFILDVAPNTEAKLKGIRKGDELIRFQDKETQHLERLFEQVNKLRPGKEVTLWVRRGVQTIQFKIRAPKHPGAAPEEEKAAKDGEGADGEKKAEKKKRKKGPIVIKPIPAPEP
jgi:S1-C subfamily serine protease